MMDDMARAAGRKWKIEPAHAAMVIEPFFVPVMHTCDPRTFVNADKAAGPQATYQMHCGAPAGSILFLAMGCSDEQSFTRPVDCHIPADPAAHFLVFWQRQSQWSAIAKGQLLA